MLHKWHLMHFIISTFNSKDQGKLQESFEPWVASVNGRKRISSGSDSPNNPAGIYPESFPEKKAFHGLDCVMSIRLTLMGSTIINFQPFGNGWLFDSKVWSKRGTIIMWRQLLFLYCSRELIQRQRSVTVEKFTGEQTPSQSSNYQYIFIAASRKRYVMLSDAVELGVFKKRWNCMHYRNQYLHKDNSLMKYKCWNSDGYSPYFEILHEDSKLKRMKCPLTHSTFWLSHMNFKEDG